MKIKIQTSAILILLFAIFHATPAISAPQNYIFDKDHSTILFTVNHLGFSHKISRFKDYDGSFTFDEEHPEQGSVNVTIKPAGIETDVPLLNKVLQGKDWFNTNKYSEIKFESTKVTILNPNNAAVDGWLTMLGKKKLITLNVLYNKTGKNPATGEYIAGFSANSVIKRSRFGMDKDIPFIGDEVLLHIEVEGIRK